MSMTLKIEIKDIEAPQASEVIRMTSGYLDGLCFDCAPLRPKMSFSYEEESPNIAMRESTPFSRYINSPTVPENHMQEPICTCE